MTDENDPLRERVRVLQIYIGIFLLVVGTCGNILAFIVLRQKALRIHATAFLLSVLAICDLGCLYLGLLNKVVEYFVGEDVFRTKLSILCSSQVFLLYCSLQYSSWLVVLVAAERFISVWFPMQSRAFCTVRNVKIAALAILLILASINCQFLFTTGIVWQTNTDPERIHGIRPILSFQFNASSSLPANEHQIQQSHQQQLASSKQFANFSNINNDTTTMSPGGTWVCDAKPEYDNLLNQVWPYVDMTIFCFIPFVIMLILNFLIAWRILSIRRISGIGGSSGRSLSGLTAIMFACCFSFFALTLPISVYMIYRSKIPADEPQKQAIMYLIWTVVNLLQYTSNAINFFLYCLSGTLFRRELMKLVRLWQFKLKSLFCCWYCCPYRIPGAYSDYAEADIGPRFKKPEKGDRLKLADSPFSEDERRKSSSLFSCIQLSRSNDNNNNGNNKNAGRPSKKQATGNDAVDRLAAVEAEQQPFIDLHYLKSAETQQEPPKLQETQLNNRQKNNVGGQEGDVPVKKKSFWKQLTSRSAKPPVNVLSTLFDSEATSGGAYAVAMMAAVKEESIGDLQVGSGTNLGSVPENQQQHDNEAPDDDDIFSYRPPVVGPAHRPASRRHQHLFHSFGPMC